MLYYFLLLIATPTPTCVLWLDRPPLVSDYYPPACPLDLMLPWDNYNLHLVGQDGVLLCEWAAADQLTQVPCQPATSRSYIIEVWLNGPMFACNLWLRDPEYSIEDITEQCSEWQDEFLAGELTILGPWEVSPPEPVAPACTLPQVDNSQPIGTSEDYQFLAGRLAWWGIHIPAWEWQNRFDEQIRGAADVAGVPASLLKGMLANESQFWPMWTGDAGEVGWLQLTWDGADNALRNDPELFSRYCQLAIWPMYCTGYDILTSEQRYAVRSELLADLAVTGTPVDAADQAAEDMWIYAHVLRAYACQASTLYPERDVWQTAAVLYNAGAGCIQGEVICSQGRTYLDNVMWLYWFNAR
jgi:hypothetical protein